MPRFLRSVTLAVLAALVLAAPASAAGDQVIVKFAPGKASSAAMPRGATLGNTIHALGSHVVKTTGDPAAVAAELNARPGVEYAEVDKPMQLLATPNDPRYPELYGLNNTGQTGGASDADIDAPEGWDLAGMSAFPATGGVKVGIVDTGITQTHEDLAGKTADCGQSVGGAITVGMCVDDNGHGTHVAGTIAAIANNGRGVAGVAFNSPLSICKALNAAGSGTTSDVASCITWEADRGVKVISMSLGGGAATTLRNAVRYAANHDVVVVAAAGNDGNATLNYPAAYAEVVSVAATDSRDAHATFSNANSDVEVAAPGVNILSTYNDGGYRVLSGTSMATPHAAGVAAVIRTKNPTFTAALARSKLDASVDDKGPAGRDTQFGFGRVNLVKAAS
ncbi:MAG: thermitase [Solirubrobacteraceae bacterium]|nr:thermitase [Solirubrobacteraceae bacterium]